MLRIGAPLVAAFCGGALSGCGTGPIPDPPSPGPAPTPTTPAPTPPPAKTPTRKAWDNHFEAFGKGVGSAKGTDDRNAALVSIMEDYDATSIVSIWDAALGDAENCLDGQTTDCKPKVEFTGLTAIRGMFDGLFDNLQTCDADGEGKLAAKEVDLTEPTDTAAASVFLVWECKRKGYKKATDTFVFDGVKIRKQNIVIEKGTTAMEVQQPVSLSQGILVATDPHKPDSVDAAWQNHFAAFDMGAKGDASSEHKEALDKIMLDYVEESVVHLASYYKDTAGLPGVEKFEGKANIRGMFKSLFQSITDVSDLAAPLVQVSGDKAGEAKQVFLVWRIPASKTDWATDTFVFDNDNRIIKQNIVVYSKDQTTPTAAFVF